MINSNVSSQSINSKSTRRKSQSQHLIDSIEILSQLVDKKLNFKELIKSILDGLENKSDSNFRSVLWKLCLGIVPADSSSDWEKILKIKREDYYKKISNFVLTECLNYIYTEDRSEFKSEFEDIFKSLPKSFIDTLGIIKLDVDRTFQEIDLFRNKNVKETLARVMCVWTLDNADIGYCQGMNEILGTLFYALYPNNLNDENIDKNESNSSYLFYLLNSEEHFEADLYEIFSEMMKRSLKDLYNYNDSKYKENYKNGLVDGFEMIDKTSLTLEEIQNSNCSKLKKRINRIFYFYLKIADRELFLYLYDKVEPYIFLFRWILCLLNREIPLKDILHVWDCIIGVEYLDKVKQKAQYEDINKVYLGDSELEEDFNFLDFLCVSMICSLKEDILKDDDNCYLLSYLMHFPQDKNIKEIIAQALKIRNLIYDYLKTNDDFVLVD